MAARTMSAHLLNLYYGIRQQVSQFNITIFTVLPWSRPRKLGPLERTQTMKGKSYATKEKIRILRQADIWITILEAYRETNISEQTFHRWNREFWMMDATRSSG